MVNLLQYSHLIRQPQNTTVKVASVYSTQDIIDSILRLYKNSELDVQEFANAIPTMSVRDLSESLFEFILANINYIEDTNKIPNDPIYQAVKKPAKFWFEKEGDCKSITLFIVSVLKAKGIKHTIRFVSYSSEPKYTHVYALAHDGKQTYIIDPVWGRIGGKFNTQKKFTFKKDYMSGLYEMSGVGEIMSGRRKINYKRGMLRLPHNMNEAGSQAAIYKQRLEIERDLIAKMRGENSSKVQDYDRTISVLTGFIGATETNDFDAMESIISGIGAGKGKKILSKLKTIAKKGAKIAFDPREQTKLLIKSSKAATKLAAKTITEPTKLATKLAIEMVFPVIAPAFIYLFIDSKLVSKLPAKVQSKRNKQLKVEKFITGTVGMKQVRFRQILRNGIMKKFGKSPEAILAAQFKGIAGIGWIQIVIALLPKIIELIKKLASMFGKKKQGDEAASAAKDMMPSADDFAGTSSSVLDSLSTSLINKNNSATQPGKSLEVISDDNIPDEDTSSIKESDGVFRNTSDGVFRTDESGGKTGAKGICG